MLLSQIVKINEEALVANAVNFDLMNDPEKNLQLCRGFVFNYDSDPEKLKDTTVGVLDAIRRSFHSSKEPNVHLMVQDYGKGKSHFALTIANFFQKPYNSQEVEGILQQVENATNTNHLILEGLIAHKKQGRNLVICLSGDKTIDLKKHFIQALRKALDSEGITNALGQEVCKRPLKYLENLNTQEREIAETYLAEEDVPEGDLDSIMQLLRDDNYQVISRVKEISRRVTGTGIPLDFEADIDVEKILTELINKLCTGENRRFQGVLILFDELYNYLQTWANDPPRAGGTTLQGITKVCEIFQGKIALISFSQRRPKSVTQAKHEADYNILASRLELLYTTYEPAASLELVLDGLLTQQESNAAWQNFFKKWGDTLARLNTDVYQNHTANYYKSRNWQPQDFFAHITTGCFPLHPLTSYLLCNLDFTQGRTAIQFIQTDVKDFIQREPFEKNENLNFIYPVTLVNAFADNFAASDYSTYSEYKHVHDSIVASADIEELDVIKALFLFYASASAGKLTKPESEKHQKILSLLTGLSEVKINTVLDKLSKDREVIQHSKVDNTYRFYQGGFGIQDARKRLDEKTKDKTLSIENVKVYCHSNINLMGINTFTTPTQFIEENRLNSGDWQFKCEIHTVSSLRQTLNTQQARKEEIGTVAYVIAETTEELTALKNEIITLLIPPASNLTSIKSRIVVAVASHPAADIAKLLFKLDYAKRKSDQEKPTVVEQLQKELQEQINKKIKDLFNSCSYYCHVSHKVSINEATNLSRVTSILLKDLYRLVAPQEKNDKIALKSSKGSEIIGYASKRLLEDDLRLQAFPQLASYKNLIEPVFVKSWGMLKQVSGSKFSVQIPVQSNVKAAWDKISQLTALEEVTPKTVKIIEIWETLSNPPYGYNEYTFTILFAAWLAYHRSEVSLSGSFGIPKKSSDNILRCTEAVKKWADTNIFDKPKDFVNVWIKKMQPSLIRSQPISYPEVPKFVDYEQAEKFIQEISDYLANDPDIIKVAKITDTQQKLSKSVELLKKKLVLISQAERILDLENEAIIIDIEQILENCNNLQEKLPIINEGVYSVIPTPQQQERRQEVSQAVIEKIGQLIDSECARIDSLDNETDCITYKSNISKLKNQISQFTYLPPRFAEQLQSAIQASNTKLSEIAEQSEVNKCIQDVQRLYDSLNALARQNEYCEVITQIEERVAAAPIAREKDIYKKIIKDLEAKQEALTQEISDCENQFSASMSSVLAINLNNKIHQLIPRVTDEDTKERLNNLLSRLEGIILQRESEDREAEDIQDTLDTARRKLTETRNAKKLNDAFNAYKELDRLTFPYNIQAASLRNRKQELDGLKSEGCTIISNKIKQVFDSCDQSINQNSDYDKVRNYLQQVNAFITTCDDFRRLLYDLREAEETLQAQYDEFQKHEQDKKHFSAIRQKSPRNANTIRLCEEAIVNIDSLKNNFSYPEKFISEVDKLLQEFTDKINSYKHELNNLQENLSKAKTSQQVVDIKNAHAHLKLIFNDSSEYNAYQELQAVIDSVAEDMKLMNYWESFYKQSNSIASCDSTLETISQEKATLHDINRFEVQLEQLQANLLTKKQGYVDQLNELETKLSSITNRKEAQTLQTALTNKSSYYQASQLEQRYQSVCSELSTLNNLLQIAETQKVDTIDKCTLEKERLQQWRQNTGEIPATVQNRYNAILAELEKAQQKLENQQREAAKKWFDDVVAKKQRLETNSESVKLNDAISLLKQIKQQKHQYEQTLQSEEQQTLSEISTYCLEIQNQDKESKIISLFQELPRSQRESLLQRLTDINASTTEEF